MNEANVLRLLKIAIEDAGSLRKWAKANKISPGYVSLVMREKMSLGVKILRPLGIEKRVDYRRRA